MRVTEITSTLKYKSLVNREMIPDILPFFDVASRKFPPFVYKTKDFAFFGMLMDYWVRVGFKKDFNVELGKEPSGSKEDIEKYQSATSISQACLPALNIVRQIMGREGFSKEDIINYIPTLVNLSKELNVDMVEWKEKLGDTLTYNCEFVRGSLSGHPDVITPQVILDIKTTSTFKAMGESACLQILAYYALAKIRGLNPRRIGIIFPLQREVQMVTIHRWDYRPYLNMLLECSKPRIKVSGPSLLTLFPIGKHISKKTIMESLGKRIISNFPIQIFTRSPRGKSESKLNNQEILQLGNAIRKYKSQLFVHAPYYVNICKDLPWIRKVLEEEVEAARKISSRGVVVHTGSACGIRRAKALDNMENTVRHLLTYATPECKVLLETPCGEGEEVCTSSKDMNDFFGRFTEDELSKLGLCVDTAHVHGAGYNTLNYILEWFDIGRVKLELVHYNDSAVCCGSCVDKHEVPGHGKIGYEDMLNVAAFCTSNKISMLFE